jgi:hypothetical protein
MPLVYKLKRNGWNEWFELRISKTAKAMRYDIVRMGKSWDKRYHIGDFSDTLGMVHPVLSTGYCFAYCFLNEENLTPGIIAHECGHLSMARERFIIRFGMDYGDDCNEHEERMLGYMTSCIDGIYDVLKTNKLIRR